MLVRRGRQQQEVASQVDLEHRCEAASRVTRSRSRQAARRTETEQTTTWARPTPYQSTDHESGASRGELWEPLSVVEQHLKKMEVVAAGTWGFCPCNLGLGASQEVVAAMSGMTRAQRKEA